MEIPAFCWIFFVIVFAKTATSQNDEISRWIYGFRTLLKGCPTRLRENSDNQNFLSALRQCLQHRTVATIDTLLMDDVIPIVDGINLVRYENRFQVDSTIKQFDSNQTNDIKTNENSKNDTSWEGVLTNRLIQLFRTHVMKIDLDKISRGNVLSLDNSAGKNMENIEQGRRRHHRRKGIFPIMMMGFIFVAAVLIPMGFQFLAVLGGKALILAKMALILSSIQGLKKIATNGINYGLYHSPVSEGWHERSSHQETRTPVELPYKSYSQQRFIP